MNFAFIFMIYICLFMINVIILIYLISNVIIDYDIKQSLMHSLLPLSYYLIFIVINLTKLFFYY
jgi:hypothetical protein